MHRRSNVLKLLLLLLPAWALLPAQQDGGRTATTGQGITQTTVEEDPIPSPDDAVPGFPGGTNSRGSTAGSVSTGDSVPGKPAPNQPGNTVSVPSKPQEPTKQGEVYKFVKSVEEVKLNATVIDQKQRLVTDLDKNAFTVFEDGKPQKITYFKYRDVPVSLGILIDNSGSMRDKRQAVNEAAVNLVRASNPGDEVFIVNFNDDAYVDQEFTSDIAKLKQALEHIDSRGGTAVYDTVVASADYLAKGAKEEKKVLLIVTDGEDNASRLSLEQTIRRVQDEKGPVIYTIGILGGERQKRAKRALEALALQTGGVAFFPKDLTEVEAISQAVAHDIRNQYIIQYKSEKAADQSGYRQVRVEANAKDRGKLLVRTRSGYYPGQEKGSTKVAQQR